MSKKIFDRFIWWKWCLAMPIIFLLTVIFIPIHLLMVFTDWFSDFLFDQHYMDNLINWAEKSPSRVPTAKELIEKRGLPQVSESERLRNVNHLFFRKPKS